MRKAGHELLNKAKSGKNDEFYTQLSDIERELQYYTSSFDNKIVFCNCDNFRISNFFLYFVNNFKNLNLKKIICACYVPNKIPLLESTKGGYYCEYTGKNDPNNEVKYFKGDGDFRSLESKALLKSSDIIVTNPPFSLFREFLHLMIEYNKQFLIIANINAITYKDVFKLIKENKIWLGVNLGRGISGFIVPNSYSLYGLETKIDDVGQKIISPNNCLWLTNIENAQFNKKIILSKKYAGNENKYPFYDNYKAININRTQDIPQDYMGEMGVPITFLHKYNPKQFQIIKFRKGDDGKDLTINGKPTYFRIIIKPIYKGRTPTE